MKKAILGFSGLIALGAIISLNVSQVSTDGNEGISLSTLTKVSAQGETCDGQGYLNNYENYYAWPGYSYCIPDPGECCI